ncbi:unnamed protein product [Heterobilharzia americana]|nr:unnamed protein product [Heterobilharzia americana]
MCWIRREIKDCVGSLNKRNDVVFLGKKTFPTVNLVYFGGDIQDYESNMRQNKFTNQYIKWSLENTAQNLYERFTNQFSQSNPHVWIIRASQWIANSLACYVNFLSFTKSGIPLFENNEIYEYTAVRHLNCLLSNAVKHLSNCESDVQCQVLNIPLRLIGFSKGCCVLTELIYELSVSNDSNETSSHLFSDFTTETNEICKSLSHIYWLDSGHPGIHHQWPVSVNYLSLLKPATCPKIHVHATPYQIMNHSKPQKSADFNRFLDILSQFNLPFTKVLHFMADTSRISESISTESEKIEVNCSLERHFEILNQFEF